MKALFTIAGMLLASLGMLMLAFQMGKRQDGQKDSNHAQMYVGITCGVIFVMLGIRLLFMR